MSPPIIGYRAWRVEGNDLRSVFVGDSVWTVGERMVAECLPQAAWYGRPISHAAPDQKCACGIYARTTLAGIFDELWLAGMAKAHSVVVGAVAMFGNTYHGKNGPHVIRAQHAQPICLLASDAWYPMQLPDDPEQDLQAWRDMLERVSQRYGLPIVPRTGIEQYAAEFGEPLSTTEDARVTHTVAEPRWRTWWPWGLGFS